MDPRQSDNDLEKVHIKRGWNAEAIKSSKATTSAKELMKNEH